MHSSTSIIPLKEQTAFTLNSVKCKLDEKLQIA